MLDDIEFGVSANVLEAEVMDLGEHSTTLREGARWECFVVGGRMCCPYRVTVAQPHAEVGVFHQ